jgi:hypothetical protein
VRNAISIRSIPLERILVLLLRGSTKFSTLYLSWRVSGIRIPRYGGDRMLDFLESKTSPRSDTELNVHSNTGPRLPSARLVLEMASKGGTVNREVLFSRRPGHLTSPVLRRHQLHLF